MPIEIRELHIKAVVDGGGETKGDAVASQSESKTEQQSEGNTDQLIDLCVEKVLEIIKEKRER